MKDRQHEAELEYRKMLLDTYFIEYRNLLDEPLDGVISKIQTDIRARYKHLAGKPSVPYPTNPTDEDLSQYLLDSQEESNMMMDALFVEDQLVSLTEVKIIYAFKNLEVHCKRITLIAFPDTPKNKIKQFVNLLDYLSNDKGITINDIEGFQDIDQLRHVNNKLKHAEDFYEQIGDIPEFKTKEGLSAQLTSFYQRVQPAPTRFIKSLASTLFDKIG